MAPSTPTRDPGSAKGSKLASRTSGIPRLGSFDNKQPDASSKFVLDGEGLSLCQPKISAQFVVRSATGSRLKITDLKAAIKGSASVKVEVKQMKNGALSCHYTCPMTGEYRLSLHYGTMSLSAKPLAIQCERPRPSERHSLLEALQEHAFVDEVVRYRLTTFDQFSARYTPKADVKAAVCDGDSPLFEAGVHDAGGGVYDIGFTPSVAGSYTLDIAVDGRRLPPCAVKVKADETIPGNSKLYGAELSQGTAGCPLKFMIQAVDGKHNARTCGGDHFIATITGPDGNQSQAEIRDRGDGTYQVVWSANTAGLYLIAVALDGSLVGGGPVQCKIAAAAVDSSKCFVLGAGLKAARAGVPASFRIQACDRFGNLRKQGGDEFTVVAERARTNAAAVPGHVEDLGLGNYHVTYTVNFTGEHRLSVRAGEQHVHGSPFKVLVSPGDAQPKASRLFGPGMSAVHLGRPTELYIELVDEFGNRVTSTSQLQGLELQVEGPAPVKVLPAPLRDGNLTYQYIAKEPGEYRISARVDNVHIQNSPGIVHASVDEAVPQLCELLGAPLSMKLKAGQKGDFSFVARDKRGTQKSLGGDLFTARWTAIDGPGQPSSGKVQDLGTGEYSCSFSDTRAGQYQVRVRMKDVDIAGSPFIVEVEHTEPCASLTTCTGEALHGAHSGQTAAFHVKPHDKYGNPVLGGVSIGPTGIQAELVGPETVSVVWQGAASDGCGLAGSYTARAAGAYQLSVTHGGQHVKGSPFALAVQPGPGSAQASQLQQLPAAVKAGALHSVKVCTRDVYGNPTPGGDAVHLEVDGGEDLLRGDSKEVEVVDHHNGTYTAQLQLRTAGMATVTAFVNQELLGLPQTIAVEPAEPASLCVVGGGALQCRAGQPAHVLLVARDKYNNVVRDDSLVSIHAQAVPQQAAAASGAAAGHLPVVAEGFGSFRVKYCLKTTGRFQVVAALAKQPERRIALNGECLPGPSSLPHSQVDAWPQSLQAGSPGELRIQHCDAWGNRLRSLEREEALVVDVVGSGSMRAEVAASKGGTSIVQIDSRTAGAYELTVRGAASGEALAGSPFAVAVVPGPPSASSCRMLLAGAAAAGVVDAGSTVVVELQLADMHGNPIREVPDGAQVALSALGQGALVRFKRSDKATCVYRAVLARAGAWVLSACVGGCHMSNSPLALMVQVAAPHAERCRVTIDGGSSAPRRVGQAVSGTLQLHDKFDNALLTGGGAVQVVCKPAGSNAARAAAVDDQGDGTFAWSFVPDQPGRWELKHTVDGAMVRPGGPMEVCVEEGPVAQQECVIVWPSFKPDGGPACGSSSSIAVRAKEEARLFSGSEVVRAAVTTPGGSCFPLPMTLAPDKRAYVGDIHWVEAGPHSVKVFHGGEQLPGSPASFHALAGPIHLPNCTLQGDLAQCVAGQPLAFSVAVRDASGNDVLLPGGQLSVEVQSLKPGASSKADAAVKLAESGPGQLQGQLQLQLAGPFQLVLLLPDKSQPGSATTRSFRGMCRAADPAADKCRLEEVAPALVAGQAHAFKLRLADRFGNRLRSVTPTQLAAFSCSLEGSGGAAEAASPVPLRDAGDGFLAGDLCIKQTGSFSLHIRVHGKPLAETPPGVSITPAQLCPSLCSASLRRCHVAAAGVRSPFGSWHSSSKGGHPTIAIPRSPGAGGPQLSPKPGTPPRAVTRSSSSSTGRSGRSPMARDRAPSDDGHGLVPGRELEGDSVAAGEAMAVQVVFKDVFGNDIPDAASVQAKIHVAAHGPAHQRFKTCSKLGLLLGELPRAGTYLLTVSVDDHIPTGWPRILHVAAGDVDEERCVLKGAAPGAAVCCGCPLPLHLFTYDAFGNPRAHGGDVVALEAHGPPGSTAQPEAVDHHDGSYTITFNPDRAGEWKLLPVVNGLRLHGHELRLCALFGALKAEHCTAKLDESNPPSCGSKTRLAVSLTPDAAAAGRRLTGSEPFAAVVTQPSGAQYRLVPELGPGGEQLQLEVPWYVPGHHTVKLTLSGAPVPGMPAAALVAPGRSSAAGSYVLSGGDTPGADGSVSMTVVARDAFGNPTAVDPAALKLKTLPLNAVRNVSVTALDGDASQVCISACPLSPCKLQVMMDDQSMLSDEVPVSLQSSSSCRLVPISPPGGIRATAGEPCSFLVETQDSAGNCQHKAQAAVRAWLCEAGSSMRAPLECAVQELGNSGRYSVTFTCTAAADYSASVVADAANGGVEVPVEVAAAQAWPAQCTVEVLGLEEAEWAAGMWRTLRVTQRDRWGNAVQDEGQGLRIAAAGTGPGPLVTEVAEREGGEILVKCMARVAGEYSVSVMAPGAGTVGDAPVALQLRTGPPAASRSWWWVEGMDHEHSSIPAGRMLTLRLALRDEYGNEAAALFTASCCKVNAEVSGPGGLLKLEPDPLQPGLLQLQLTAAGEHRFRVTMQDPVSRQMLEVVPRGSPTVCTVVPAGVSAAQTIVRELPTALACGQPHECSVIPCDDYGNAGASGGAFSAALTDASGDQCNCRVMESQGGSRAVAVLVQPTLAGACQLEVAYEADGKRVVVAAQHVAVEQARPDAQQTSLFGFWPPQGAVAGLPCGFAVQARDAWGNACSCGGLKLGVELAGLAPGSLEVQDRCDGTYAVRYVAPTGGVYTLSVTLAGQHVKGSPMTLTVYADILGLANQEMQQRLTSTVTSLRKGVADARQMHGLLLQQGEELRQFIPLLVEGAKNSLFEAMRQQAAQLGDARKAYQQEAVERRRLHNLVQELRGNIRVFCRVKPLPEEEAAAGMSNVLNCLDDHRLEAVGGQVSRLFEYDRVFGPGSTQADVFAEVQQLVTSALDGYNVCIFAYGQTGAGKTHTMEGPRSDPGISFRTMRELFRSMEEERAADCLFEISCSIVEIYNESVRDLLSADLQTDPEAGLELKKTEAGFEPAAVTTVAVSSPDQILDIMARGLDHRAQACHDINAHSSRSHALLIINVVGTNISNGVRTVGKLTLCDLAGSERINKTGATGLTLTEAQNINKSLLELGNVMSALLSQAAHVPYRNSKLTMLLQDSLGGDSKALMFCNVTPSAAHLQETLSSLGFASKVANVSLGTPRQKLEDAGAPPRKR